MCFSQKNQKWIIITPTLCTLQVSVDLSHAKSWAGRGCRSSYWPVVRLKHFVWPTIGREGHRVGWPLRGSAPGCTVAGPGGTTWWCGEASVLFSHHLERRLSNCDVRSWPSGKLPFQCQKIAKNLDIIFKKISKNCQLNT